MFRVQEEGLRYEEERKELVYSLTHCSDPGIKFIGCIVTHLVYSLIFVD